MAINDLTYKIRGTIFEVRKELGPGLLKSVYEAAIAHELNLIGLKYVRQKGVNAEYKGFDMGLGFRMDFLVEETVIIELNSVETLHPVFWKTSLTYLKQAKKKIGYLVNFNVEKLVDKESLIRIIS